MASVLPPLYTRWADQLQGGAIPPENEATCHDCVMVAGGGKDLTPGRRYFDSTTRCCTYHPELPNFLVGPILANTNRHTAPGRRSVQIRIDRGGAVTPLGLGTPATYTVLYANGTDGFGASHALRCHHHLDDGSCGIWTHRMSVCATWFCKYFRGAVGRRFWRGLQVFLAGVEKDLARWCLLELGLDAGALGRLSPAGAGHAITDHRSFPAGWAGGSRTVRCPLGRMGGPRARAVFRVRKPRGAA